MIGDKDEECVIEKVGFGIAYSEVARDDHRLFFDAFRKAVRSLAYQLDDTSPYLRANAISEPSSQQDHP